MLAKHYATDPFVSPLAVAKVLNVLKSAARPLTRGELRMFHGLSNQKAMQLRLALERLVGAGFVVTATEKDGRSNRTYVTYKALHSAPNVEGIAS